MKKLIVIATLICVASLHLFAQKPAIDFNLIDSWPTVGGKIAIANNGQYATYSINNSPKGFSTLFIQSTAKNGWKMGVINASNCVFTEDSRNAIFKMAGDTLCVLTLASGNKNMVPAVDRYQLLASGKLYYLTKNTIPKLVLCDLNNNDKQEFSVSKNFIFSHDGRLLLLPTNDAAAQRLQLINLETGKIKNIWTGDKLAQFAFSNDDRKIAFTSGDTPAGNRLWCYQMGSDSALLVAGKNPINNNYMVDAGFTPFFSDNSNRLFFKILSIVPIPVAKPEAVQVDVWNYKEPLIHEALLRSSPNTNFLAVANLEGNLPSVRKIVQLETPERNLLLWTPTSAMADASLYFCAHSDKALLTQEVNPLAPRNLLPDLRVYRVSLDNGVSLPVNLPIKRNKDQEHFNFSISPTGKWLLYYDGKKDCWFSYNVENNRIVNISYGAITWCKDDLLFSNLPKTYAHHPDGLPLWIKGDTAVLINGDMDIWQMDPTGKKHPVSFTNRYGERHHIRLRVAKTVNIDGGLQADQEILLDAYDPVTKYNGFFRKRKVNSLAPPELLTMSPDTYSIFNVRYPNHYYTTPVKARDSALWIIGKANPVSVPNLYLTNDFKSFKSLTDIEPQKKYNWLTAELVNWRLPDGSYSQGILYKPESFDPGEKYPIIFSFYQTFSKGVYNFLKPDFSGGDINIPYFVSKGYLMFVPDISYKIGKPGQSVLDCVVSAARHLYHKYHWVDSNRMGITGESWGGYELNYLVTHSHLFAAAVDAFGMSDLVSDYGSLILFGTAFPKIEYNNSSIGYYRLNTNLWQRPDLYIKNSPIFSADKVTTPLLMLHNKGDQSVLFTQGVELFSALWELHKPAWLLQYDNGGHGVAGPDAKDFTIRLSQFFDHYLKGAPAPKWMVEGIPPDKKGIDDGLELEPGQKP